MIHTLFKSKETARSRSKAPCGFNSVLEGKDQASYTFRRALIESVSGGSHQFVSEGVLGRQRVEVQPGVIGDAIGDQRQFEGWRFCDAEDT